MEQKTEKSKGKGDDLNYVGKTPLNINSFTDQENSSLSLLFVLIGIFSLSILGLIYIYSKFPNIEE